MMRNDGGVVASDPSPFGTPESGACSRRRTTRVASDLRSLPGLEWLGLERDGPERSDAPRILLISFEVKNTMGMTDQRGDWRRVMTDGHRQAQGEGEPSPGIEAWEPDAANGGEPLGIRLLPDACSGRASGRPHAGAADQARESDPGMGPTEEPGRVEGPRHLRGDAAHAPCPNEPRGQAGRGPGPLSARIASRQRQVTPATVAIGAGSPPTRSGTARDGPASDNAIAS